MLRRQQVAMRFHYLQYVTNSLRCAPFEGIVHLLMKTEARNAHLELQNLISAMQSSTEYAERGERISFFNENNGKFARRQNDNLYNIRLDLYYDPYILIDCGDFNHRSSFQRGGDKRLIYPYNNCGRPNFQIVECLSREERNAPKEFRISISESLKNFFLEDSHFDPAPAIIYADFIEEKQGDARRAQKLRDAADALGKFAGSSGLIEIVHPSDMTNLPNATQLLQNLEASGNNKNQARKARKLIG